MSATISIPVSDYQRLLLASEADDTIVRCEGCGAWLDLLSADTFSSEDGCYGDAGCYDAAGNKGGACKSYRIPQPPHIEG